MIIITLWIHPAVDRLKYFVWNSGKEEKRRRTEEQQKREIRLNLQKKNTNGDVEA